MNYHTHFIHVINEMSLLNFSYFISEFWLYMQVSVILRINVEVGT